MILNKFICRRLNSTCSVLIITLLNVLNATGQSAYTLKGNVLDSKEKGIDLAMVSLLRTSDTTFVKSAFSDQDGSFLLSQIPQGAYFIQVNLLGYEQYRDSVVATGAESLIRLNPITLKTSLTELNEVNIVAETPYIERKIDRTVINVDALITNAGSDIMEVMERAPGITVDNQGTILLKGRSGVAIFINDKPSYLSGVELESYLRSLPAGTVKQIEIMTNPPAKYDAAGSAGVINIILKKNILQGWNGNVSLNYRQGKYGRSNNSLNLSYAFKKFNFFANSNAGFWNSYQDLNINRFYRDEAGTPLSSFSQSSIGLRNGNYLGSIVGMDYYINDRSTIGVNYKISGNPSSHDLKSTAEIRDPNQILTQTVIADNLTESSFRNNLFSAYFRNKNDSTGNTFSVDADYVSYVSGSEQLFKNYLYNNSGVLNYKDQINGDIPSQIDIYAAKADYTKQFSKLTKFEAGLKTAFTQTDNEAKYSNTIEGTTTPDLTLSNQFLYDEWINAGYLNLSHSLGKIDLQAGLRVESTKLNGEQLGNSENPPTAFSRNYTNLFPTFYASWKMDSTSNNVLNLSYGRRISRPYFQDLNPFISPLDKFTFYSGNPNLLPTFSHNLGLVYSFKSLFSVSLNYSKTVDGINETLEIRDGIYYSRPGNIASSQTLSLSFEGSIPFTEWYRLNTYLELANLKFESDLYTEQLNSQGTYYYLSATNSFNFGKGWGADLQGSYRSDMVYAQLELKSYCQIDLGFQKKILDNAGTLKLSFTDILFTRRGDGIINNLKLTDADWNSTYDSRAVSLTFSYRFGNTSLKKPRYNSDGSSEEQNRVKG